MSPCLNCGKLNGEEETSISADTDYATVHVDIVYHTYLGPAYLCLDCMLNIVTKGVVNGRKAVILPIERNIEV